jgi:hypothetical protein
MGSRRNMGFIVKRCLRQSAKVRFARVILYFLVRISRIVGWDDAATIASESRQQNRPGSAPHRRGAVIQQSKIHPSSTASAASRYASIT